tara:strand:- start:199 stop:315 length:117 start_codon:yes stop_codon:yes gene_type:complete
LGVKKRDIFFSEKKGQKKDKKGGNQGLLRKVEINEKRR